MTTGLAALNLSLFDPPAAVPAPTPRALVVTQRTNNGNTILVCTVDPIPEIEIQRAIDQGLPIFGPSEIAQMRQITPRLAENPKAEADIINIKLTFPRAEVHRTRDLTPAGRKRAA